MYTTTNLSLKRSKYSLLVVFVENVTLSCFKQLYQILFVLSI